jgi:hypothetical protein
MKVGAWIDRAVKFVTPVPKVVKPVQPPPIKRSSTATVIHKHDISPEVMEAMRFFSPYSPCWFEGCNELRTRFQEEESEMLKTPNCPNCYRGRLIRKFLPEVQELLRKHKLNQSK